MADQPVVSVVVPVYNGERFLVEAVRSVLDQIPPPGEIIMVDDGSTDGTAHIIAGLSETTPVPVRYAYQENQGPAAARNHGLELAGGEIIAFQDSDDLWPAGRLALQLRMLALNPAAHAVIGQTRLFFTDERAADLSAAASSAQEPCWFLGIHSGLYRRSAFEIVGTFNDALRCHEDIDWFRRARAAALVIRSHKDPVLLHRRHAGNMTNDRERLAGQLLHMLKRSPRVGTGEEESLLTWLTAVSWDGRGERGG